MIADFQYEWLREALPDGEFIQACQLPEGLTLELYSDILDYGIHWESVAVFSLNLHEKLIKEFTEQKERQIRIILKKPFYNDSKEMDFMWAILHPVLTQHTPAGHVMRQLYALRARIMEDFRNKTNLTLSSEIMTTILTVMWFLANKGNCLQPDSRMTPKIASACQEIVDVVCKP